MSEGQKLAYYEILTDIQQINALQSSSSSMSIDFLHKWTWYRVNKARCMIAPASISGIAYVTQCVVLVKVNTVGIQLNSYSPLSYPKFCFYFECNSELSDNKSCVRG